MAIEWEEDIDEGGPIEAKDMKEIRDEVDRIDDEKCSEHFTDEKTGECHTDKNEVHSTHDDGHNGGYDSDYEGNHDSGYDSSYDGSDYSSYDSSDYSSYDSTVESGHYMDELCPPVIDSGGDEEVETYESEQVNRKGDGV